MFYPESSIIGALYPKFHHESLSAMNASLSNCTAFETIPGLKKDLSALQVDHFQRQGFVRHPDSLHADQVARLGERLENAARELAKPKRVGGKYDQDAFLQISGLWQRVPELGMYFQELGLARLARQALDCERVRLWGDHILIKEAGGNPTPWHSDFHYVQLESEKICAVWLPFRDLSVDEGALGFIEKSHLLEEPSRYPISPEGAGAIQEIIDARGMQADFADYHLGDCSIHYAKTLHGTRKNMGSRPRVILTVFICDADARICEPRCDFQREFPIGEPGHYLSDEKYPLLEE